MSLPLPIAQPLEIGIHAARRPRVGVLGCPRPRAGSFLSGQPKRMHAGSCGEEEPWSGEVALPALQGTRWNSTSGSINFGIVGSRARVGYRSIREQRRRERNRVRERERCKNIGARAMATVATASRCGMAKWPRGCWFSQMCQLTNGTR